MNHSLPKQLLRVLARQFTPGGALGLGCVVDGRSPARTAGSGVQHESLPYNNWSEPTTLISAGIWRGNGVPAISNLKRESCSGTGVSVFSPLTPGNPDGTIQNGQSTGQSTATVRENPADAWELLQSIAEHQVTHATGSIYQEFKHRARARAVSSSPKCTPGLEIERTARSIPQSSIRVSAFSAVHAGQPGIPSGN